MKRGDVCWYTFRAPDKRRPVLILTRTSALGFLTGITTLSAMRMAAVEQAVCFALGMDSRLH